MAFGDKSKGWKTSAFSQGAEFQKKYPFANEQHAAIRGGICFALGIEWFKYLTKAPAELSEMFGNLFDKPDERMKKMEENYKLAAGRQRIYNDMMSEAKDLKSATIQAEKLAAHLTDLGKLYGLKFGVLQHASWPAKTIGGITEWTKVMSPADAGKAVAAVVAANKDGYIYWSIQLHDAGLTKRVGGHAISIVGHDPVLIFDPNLGEFAVPKAKAAEFFAKIYEDYKDACGNVGYFLAYGVTPQKSVFDFWKDQEKKK